ncbi:MAG: hypothetical protein N5P05_004139 (plasmid) [Chroococcopsis gigantea SAG 12.99]|nr:hypothetical protein [Chroococcopsis gigantea SAG 12.99]
MNVEQIIFEIGELSKQLTLILDSPSSVKLQVKQITLVQKQLRAIKKEVNLAIKEINQQAVQTQPDSVISVGLDLFGKRKWAGQVRQATRRTIQSEKINLRQPYMNLKDYIDRLLIEGDKLKLEADRYLSYSATSNRIGGGGV